MFGPGDKEGAGCLSGEWHVRASAGCTVGEGVQLCCGVVEDQLFLLPRKIRSQDRSANVWCVCVCVRRCACVVFASCL